jgi:hypothetical protein
MIRSIGGLDHVSRQADHAANGTPTAQFKPVELTGWVAGHLDLLFDRIGQQADGRADDEMLFRAHGNHLSVALNVSIVFND